MTEEELVDQQELFEHFRIQADPGQSILRIDKFLSDRLMNASRTRIQNAANAGNILVNDYAVKPNYKIKPGDIIQVVLPTPPREVELIPENIPLNIIYEDDDVLVLNKEPGMVVHPAHGNYTGTLVNALMWHFRDLPLFNTGESRPGLVHRLDKNTSGILVIAKNEYALNRLSKQFYDRTTDRRYNALIWGIPDPLEGTITGNVGRSVKDRKVMQVFKDGTEGKTAITHYKVLENFGYISLIECKLETGRTHQIRVHFSHVKHPLFNDSEYGGDQIIKGTTFTKYQQFIKNCFKILPRQALHAKSLAFNHPVTGKRLSFDSELPDDMVQVIEKWRKYISGRDSND
jgi:23S rRNA pseudouridine1911/1915/1917 synthase